MTSKKGKKNVSRATPQLLHGRNKKNVSETSDVKAYIYTKIFSLVRTI